MKRKLVQFISIGGILTSITVLLQSAPVFLPAIGLALSPLSTLPIALAAVIQVYLGIVVLLSSVFILIAVSLQEAMILLFTTGLLGIVIGASIYRKGLLVTILASAISLSAGMMALTYIVVVPGFADLFSSMPIFLVLAIYFLFATVYSSIWAIGIRKLRFMKIVK